MDLDEHLFLRINDHLNGNDPERSIGEYVAEYLYQSPRHLEERWRPMIPFNDMNRAVVGAIVADFLIEYATWIHEGEKREKIKDSPFRELTEQESGKTIFVNLRHIRYLRASGEGTILVLPKHSFTVTQSPTEVIWGE